MGTIQNDALIIELHPNVPWPAEQKYDDHAKEERAAMERIRDRICQILAGGERDQSHLCSPVIESGTNGAAWLFIAPDGSKEGWSISDDMDEKRREICRILKRNEATVLLATFGELDVALIVPPQGR